MKRSSKSLGEIVEGPVHVPKVARAHLAAEIRDLHGLDWERLQEYVRRLTPSLRHRAVGCKREEIPRFGMLSVHLAPPDDKGYFNG